MLLTNNKNGTKPVVIATDGPPVDLSAGGEDDGSLALHLVQRLYKQVGNVSNNNRILC